MDRISCFVAGIAISAVIHMLVDLASVGTDKFLVYIIIMVCILGIIGAFANAYYDHKSVQRWTKDYDR